MQIKGQRILVCGAGGFIGGHLVKNLQASGATGNSRRGHQTLGRMVSEGCGCRESVA